MKPGAGKASARRRSFEGFATSNRLKWGPYLQLKSVDRTANHGARRKGRVSRQLISVLEGAYRLLVVQTCSRTFGNNFKYLTKKIAFYIIYFQFSQETL